jgi:hypothetical protein
MFIHDVNKNDKRETKTFFFHFYLEPLFCDFV